jgi:hypothetical protein
VPHTCLVRWTPGLGAKREEPRVLRWLAVTKLAEDGGTVTDDLELRPLEMTRRAQASDEAAILRLIVGGGAVTMAHCCAPNDRRLA